MQGKIRNGTRGINTKCQTEIDNPHTFIGYRSREKIAEVEANVSSVCARIQWGIPGGESYSVTADLECS